MDNYLENNPLDVMKEHGKSFYFASQIFPIKQRKNIALLYSFCRYVDDLADENHPAIATKELNHLKDVIFKRVEDKKVSALINEITSIQNIKAEYLIELIEGALFDVEEGKIDSEQDLLIYCYRVAGVVGLMMCPLLEVNNKCAYRHAIDLGLAMQLTNISRDILEDAKNDRYYVPQETLLANNIQQEILRTQGQTPIELQMVVKQMLEQADIYYTSAHQGMGHIPLRARMAIVLASEIYRAIGKKLKRNNYNVLAGRTFLSNFEKIWVSLFSLRFLFAPYFWFKGPHNSNLHSKIRHMPESSQGQRT